MAYLTLKGGCIPFVRASEAKYLIVTFDSNITQRIPTEEIEGEAFETYSMLPLQRWEFCTKIKFPLHKAFVKSATDRHTRSICLPRWEYGSNSPVEIVVPTQYASSNNWTVFQGARRLVFCTGCQTTVFLWLHPSILQPVNRSRTKWHMCCTRVCGIDKAKADADRTCIRSLKLGAGQCWDTSRHYPAIVA